MKKYRRVISRLLPLIWVLSLLVPTPSDLPWMYLAFCFIAFGMGIRNGLMYLRGQETLAGVAWFLGGGIVLIMTFAKLFYYHGLVLDGAVISVSFADATYFSIVTWTTLGYGDFSPPESLRL